LLQRLNRFDVREILWPAGRFLSIFKHDYCLRV